MEPVVGLTDRYCSVFGVCSKAACVEDRLDNIGLRKFTTPSLFLELLGPVSFLMVIIIQLHYFHKDFLTISALDRFVKYAAAIMFLTAS